MKKTLLGMARWMRGGKTAQQPENTNTSVVSRKSIQFESIEPRVLMAGDPVAVAINGAIDAPGEVDQYGFTIISDINVVFDSLTNNPNINWSLSGPQGAVVNARSMTASDSADLSGSPAINLTAGDYTLTVDGNQDNTGAYQFRLLDLQNAPEIIPGIAVSGQLTAANETDVYKFNASAGDKFYFDLQNNSGSSNSSDWRLLDPFGRVAIDPKYLSNGDIDVQTMAYSGTYTLLVEGRYNATTVTDYTFNVQQVIDEAPVTLTLGTSANGTLDIPGQQDRYTFTLANPAQVYFDSLANIANLNWSLTGPHGTVINARSFTASDANGLSSSPQIDLVAGDYTLTIDGVTDTVGAYALRLLDLSAATAITLGSAVSGQLNPSRATDIYRFSANAGDQFLFDQLSVSAASTAYWCLLDPYGRNVFGAVGFTDVAVQTLNYTGNYTLLIEGAVTANSATLDYSFNVVPQGNVPVTPLPAGTPLTLNAPVTSNISVANELDQYSFTLTNPAQLYFDVLSAYPYTT